MARRTKNEDCPINGVITTASECVIAAQQLGLTYHNEATMYERPAGCYTWMDGSNAAYFNSIIDSETTFPESDTAGICRAGSIVSDRWAYLFI